MKRLFDSGNVAAVANVGTLLAPTTREMFFNGTATLPQQLFAHDIQQQEWQLSGPDATDGYGRSSTSQRTGLREVPKHASRRS